MKKRVPPTLIEKYDIGNRVLSELVDLQSRHILFSIIKKPKCAQEISRDLKIPISSVYKKIQDLLDVSLISEAFREISDSGKIIRFYRSEIDDANISITKFEPRIEFKKNTRSKK